MSIGKKHTFWGIINDDEYGKYYIDKENEPDLFMQMVDNSLMLNKPSFNNSASLSVKRSNFFRGVTSQNYKKVAAKTTRLFIVKKIINRIKRILKIK